MTRVYVGNLDPRVTERELEDEFRTFGVLRGVWVARRPPGYAFIDFDDRRDALDAIRELDGKNGWRVELSHNSRGSGGGSRGGGGGRFRDRSSGSDLKCYECGEPGHFARECRLRIGPGGAGGGRKRSRSPYSPRYRRSPSYGRRSPSPRDRSPRRRSVSPSRRRSVSPSRRRSVSPSRRRSISPRRRSVSPPRRRSISPRRDRSVSPPRRGSPRDRSASPPRRSYSKSPPRYRSRENSPYANGKVAADGDNQ